MSESLSLEPVCHSLPDTGTATLTGVMNMKKEDWKQLSEEKYRALFKGSAVKRAKYSGLIRNIRQMED